MSDRTDTERLEWLLEQIRLGYDVASVETRADVDESMDDNSEPFPTRSDRAAESARLRKEIQFLRSERPIARRVAALTAENERLTQLLARSLDYADHAVCKLSDGYGDPCGCGYEQFRADAAAALPSSRETTDG